MQKILNYRSKGKDHSLNQEAACGQWQGAWGVQREGCNSGGGVWRGDEQPHAEDYQRAGDKWTVWKWDHSTQNRVG